MSVTTQPRFPANFLALCGVIVWLAAVRWVSIPSWGAARFMIAHGLGAVTFLIIAAFLPVTRGRRFGSRQSALAAMGLLTWMSTSKLLALSTVLERLPNHWHWILILGPILLAYGSYKLAMHWFAKSGESRLPAASPPASQQSPS